MKRKVPKSSHKVTVLAVELWKGGYDSLQEKTGPGRRYRDPREKEANQGDKAGRQAQVRVQNKSIPQLRFWGPGMKARLRCP